MTRTESLGARQEALLAAVALYSRIASGEYKVYDQARYKFLDPDRRVMRDRANILSDIAKELKSTELSLERRS